MSTDDLVQERGSDYGHPKNDFAKTARIWSGLKPCNHCHELVDFVPADVPRFMIGVKLSRDVNKFKPDNSLDIQGYAKTRLMLEEELSTAIS